MRKLIVSNIMSLNGYVEGSGRDVMALPMDDFFDEQNLERLLTAGLVDELYLMIGATVLGGGTPAFDEGRVHPLRLVDTRRREASDNLLVRYEVVGRSNEEVQT